MPKIELINISKKFTSLSEDSKGKIITALENINLKIEKDTYNTLLGPSGCGKTTLLRIIAGLENPSSGKIHFGSNDVTHDSVQQRNVGFVFQNYSLFPHMNVWHNVSYGLLARGKYNKSKEKEIHGILKMVKLDDRINAYPKELSGGMQQRVAVARAIATKSPIMLLDEPLAALDARIGTDLRYDLMSMIKKYKLTAIHVTHNQEEAMTISDNIIMMKRGNIIQSGSPKDIYEKPNSIFSAYFLGRCNFFECEVLDENHVKYLDTKIQLPKHAKKGFLVIGVRPEKIHINSTLRPGNICGKVRFVNFLGEKWQYIIKLNDGNEISALKRTPHNCRVGSKVSITFFTDNIFIFDKPVDLSIEKSV